MNCYGYTVVNVKMLISSHWVVQSSITYYFEIRLLFIIYLGLCQEMLEYNMAACLCGVLL